MHATKLITPGVMLMLFLGLIAFVVIYRVIFRKNDH
jgi:hypothetical protein